MTSLQQFTSIFTSSSDQSLGGLMDAMSEWIMPIYLAAIAIFALIFIKDRAWMKLVGFTGIAAVVGVLMVGLFGEQGALTEVATNAADDISVDSEATDVEPTDAAESAPEQDPFVVPEFENGGTILIVLGIVAVVVIGGLIAWGVISRNRHTYRLIREEQAAIEADKQAAIDEWNEYVKLHKELQDKVYNSETDWDILFFYPAINDSSIPETRDMLFAMGAVKNISSQPPASLNLDTDMASLRYPKMVQEFEQAWDIAWNNAQKMQQSTLTMKERRTIDKIMHMLKRTKDGASTESEKQIAFERIDVLLGDLTSITVPDRAYAVLAQGKQQALSTSGTEHTLDGSGVTVSGVLSTQGSGTLTTPHDVLATKKVQ